MSNPVTGAPMRTLSAVLGALALTITMLSGVPAQAAGGGNQCQGNSCKDAGGGGTTSGGGTTTTTGTTTAGATTAATVSGLTPLGWDVIGLDSNKVNTGPNMFQIGVRIANGATTEKTFSATWTWGSENAYVNLASGSSATRSGIVIPAGGSKDVYWSVVVTRDAKAHFTSRKYSISATDGTTTLNSPANRQLYVEKLISQNRNKVDSISGPADPAVGETVTYVVNGSTASDYGQVVFVPYFDPNVLQLESASITYALKPAGKFAPNDQVYADACGWENDYTKSGTYRSCAGKDGVGKAITGTYRVKVVGEGDTSLNVMIYDFSGSSYHYNSDHDTSGALKKVKAAKPGNLTITYDANCTLKSGSAPVDSKKYAANAKATALENSTPMVCDKKKFEGWNTQKDGKGTKVNPKDLVTIKENTTLYSMWKDAKGFSVTYLPNLTLTGGSAPVDPTEYEVGKSAIAKNGSSMAANKKSFLSWNTKSDGSGTTYTPDGPVIVNDDVILYAQWKDRATFKVTYVPNEPLTSGSAPVDSTDYEDGKDATIKPSSPMVVTGKTFKGWNTAADGSGKNYSPADVATITNDLVLFGQWSGPATPAPKASPSASPAAEPKKNSPAAKNEETPKATPAQTKVAEAAVKASGAPAAAAKPIATDIAKIAAEVPEDCTKNKFITRTVFFDSGKPDLTAASRATLDGLIEEVQGKGIQVCSRVIGFVQPTPFRGNDFTLSGARAKNVADYIRANGAVRVAASTGLGRADESGAVARRATATIYYK